MNFLVYLEDFKYTLKHLKEELTLVELGSHLRIEESLKAQDNDKPKSNNVDGPLVVNMLEHNNSSMYYDNKEYLKKDCKAGNVGNKANGSGKKGLRDSSSSSLKGTTVHVCKDRCWFKTYDSLNDGSILHMGNESTTLVHGRGCVDLRFSSGKVVSLLNVVHVPNIRKNLHVTPSLGNKKYFVTFIDDASRFCCVYLLHSKDDTLDKFKVFKTEVEIQQGSLIKRFRIDRGGTESNPKNEKPRRAFFVFGDSLVDNGNNNHLATTARADSPPYGIDYPNRRPTGRFSNGLNLPDVIG
nr:zinc finger, CCHC-type [Tanacetum cinerariifolium]